MTVLPVSPRLADLYRQHAYDSLPPCAYCGVEKVMRDPELCGSCAVSHELIGVPVRDDYGVQIGVVGWLFVRRNAR